MRNISCVISLAAGNTVVIIVAAAVLAAVIISIIVSAVSFHRTASKIRKLGGNLPQLKNVRSMVNNALDQQIAAEEAERNAPEKTASARLIAKRTQVFGRLSRTFYYAGFELENGERIELRLPGSEYGLLAEGDAGTLTYKGSRMISFTR